MGCIINVSVNNQSMKKCSYMEAAVIIKKWSYSKRVTLQIFELLYIFF